MLYNSCYADISLSFEKHIFRIILLQTYASDKHIFSKKKRVIRLKSSVSVVYLTEMTQQNKQLLHLFTFNSSAKLFTSYFRFKQSQRN